MGNNSNSNYSKNSAMTKRGRFNANPTACNHPSCSIAARAKLDKKNADKNRRTLIFTSKARSLCSL